MDFALPATTRTSGPKKKKKFSNSKHIGDLNNIIKTSRIIHKHTHVLVNCVCVYDMFVYIHAIIAEYDVFKCLRNICQNG